MEEEYLRANELADMYIEWANSNKAPGFMHDFLAGDIELEWCGKKISGRTKVVSFISAQNMHHQKLVEFVPISDISDEQKLARTEEISRSLESAGITDISDRSYSNINVSGYTDPQRSEPGQSISAIVRKTPLIKGTDDENYPSREDISQKKKRKLEEKTGTDDENDPSREDIRQKKKKKLEEETGTEDTSREDIRQKKKRKLELQMGTPIENITQRVSEEDKSTPGKTPKHLYLRIIGYIILIEEDSRDSKDFDVNKWGESYELQIDYIYCPGMTDEVMEESTKESSLKSEQKSMKESSDELLQESAKESSLASKENPMKESSDELLQESAKESSLESVENPMKESSDSWAKKSSFDLDKILVRQYMNKMLNEVPEELPKESATEQSSISTDEEISMLKPASKYKNKESTMASTHMKKKSPQKRKPQTKLTTAALSKFRIIKVIYKKYQSETSKKRKKPNIGKGRKKPDWAEEDESESSVQTTEDEMNVKSKRMKI